MGRARRQLAAQEPWEIKVSRKHLRALLPDESRDELRENEKEAGPQQRRVLEALKKLYPPEGKVPDDVPTEVVRGQVTKELSADSKNREKAAPSWDTVHRALGPRLISPQHPHNPHCGTCGETSHI